MTARRSSASSTPPQHRFLLSRSTRVAPLHIRVETSLHKQSHLFRDSSLTPLSYEPRGKPFPFSLRISPHPSSESGANSIHGFITVQITTIYLHANFCGLGLRAGGRACLELGLIERKDGANPMTGSLKKASETGSHLAFGSISL